MAGLKDKPMAKGVALFAGLLQAAAIYLVYLSLSLTDIWGYMPPVVQFVVYGFLALVMVIITYRGLIMKSPWGLGVSLKAAFLSVTLLSIAAILAGADRQRLLEIAVKPRAIFAYPVPEIILTVSPPAYSKGQEFTERLTDLSGGLKPMAEGSKIRIQVKNMAFPPRLIAGQRHVEFLPFADGGFVAQFILKDEIVWQIREGSRAIGQWQILILADDSPVIERVDFRQIMTGDGLFALSLHLSDDYGLQEVSVGVVSPGGNTDVIPDRAILKISDLKEFSGEVYVNLASSSLAGSRVDLIVEATDQAGQKQQKILSGIFLPAKKFANPLARDLIDIRQRILTEPQNRKKLARQLMAKGLVPDYGRTPIIYYMALRSAFWRLNESKNEADINSVRDILWDLANQMEDEDRGEFNNDILALLATLKLTLYQGQDMDRIRSGLQDIDKAIVLFMQMQTDQLDSEKFDVTALRKIYGKILTLSQHKKIDPVIDLISFLENGFIYSDRNILSAQGFKQFQIISQALVTVEMIKKNQRSVMSFVYKNSVEMEIVSLNDGTAGRLKASFNKDIQKWITIQQNLEGNVKDLARTLAKSRIKADQIIVATSDLMRDVVHSMEAGAMETAAQYQSEILTLLNRLKDRLDRQIQYSAEKR